MLLSFKNLHLPFRSAELPEESAEGIAELALNPVLTDNVREGPGNKPYMVAPGKRRSVPKKDKHDTKCCIILWEYILSKPLLRWTNWKYGGNFLEIWKISEIEHEQNSILQFLSYWQILIVSSRSVLNDKVALFFKIAATKLASWCDIQLWD